MKNKIYVVILDEGLNGFWVQGAYRERQDVSRVYREWFDDLTRRKMGCPYENGMTQYEIDVDTLETKEL